MGENVFINDFISMGMHAFFNGINACPFEVHIIECMCDVYGTENLKQIYIAKDESAFLNLIHKYGLARNIYDNFIRDTIIFEKFKEENKQDPSIKSDIASKIEVAVIKMFLYKCLLFEPTLEEISHFENNLLNNFTIIKMHFNTSLDPNETRNIWEQKKRILSDNVELVEIKPKLLDEETYAKFGTSLKDVKEMDYRMVEELNKYIESKLATMTVEAPTTKKKSSGGLFKNTVLTSGNGFVDGLLITSIIATIISSVLIYIFLNM